MFLYRALRLTEAPTSLRQPDTKHLTDLNWSSLRRRALEAIATGNSSESPFLHCTTDLHIARRIASERSKLYSGVIVRFPRSALPKDHIIELDTDKARKQSGLLQECVGDDNKILDSLSIARAYTAKDKECLLLSCPHTSDIDVIDPYTGEKVEAPMRFEEGWAKYCDPSTCRIWYYHSASEKMFWESIHPDEWKRYRCAEGLWWCNDTAKVWFWDH